MSDLLKENETQCTNRSKQLPKKIKIIGIYRLGNIQRGLIILKTVDKNYLVLSDKGLCFGPDTVPEEKLSNLASDFPMLPKWIYSKKVNYSKPWNYEITLSEGHSLWVKLENEKGVIFGIK